MTLMLTFTDIYALIPYKGQGQRSQLRSLPSKIVQTFPLRTKWFNFLDALHWLDLLIYHIIYYTLWKIQNEKEWQYHSEWEYLWFASHMKYIYFIGIGFTFSLHISFYTCEWNIHCRKFGLRFQVSIMIPIFRVYAYYSSWGAMSSYNQSVIYNQWVRSNSVVIVCIR